MSAFLPIKAGGWAFGEVLTSGQMNQLNTDFPFALNGRDGGSYAPSSAIVIAGAGLTIGTGTNFTIASGSDLLVTSGSYSQFNGPVVFASGGFVSFTGSASLTVGCLAAFTGAVTASQGITPRFLLGPDADTTVDPMATDSVHITGATAPRTYTIANTPGGHGRVIHFTCTGLANNVVVKDFAGNTLTTLRGNSATVGGAVVQLINDTTAKVAGLYTVP